MKKKVYIETTIPSYIVSRPSKDISVLTRQLSTKFWWKNFLPFYDCYISPVVIDEVQAGDKVLAKKRVELVKSFNMLHMNDEIKDLAERYFKYFSLPKAAFRDAYHMAFSVYFKVDFLVTWNCKHLANAEILQSLQRINAKIGLLTPILCTPDELTPMEKERSK